MSQPRLKSATPFAGWSFAAVSAIVQLTVWSVLYQLLVDGSLNDMAGATRPTIKRFG